MNWQKNLPLKVKLNEPLKQRTSFKIGGEAKFFIESKDTAGLKLLLKRLRRYKMPYLVIGSGSNILVSDKGIKSPVISLAAGFSGLKARGMRIEAGSGLKLVRLSDFAQKQGLGGMEFLRGIPGTVGGAVVMNAGCWGKSTGDLIESVRVMDALGRVRNLRKKDIPFGYRCSGLEKYIILSAVFKLVKKNTAGIKKEAARYLEARRKTQDNTFANAGCIFKNPPGESAGRLIDLCGLKGKKQGGAFISLRHANFILNSGRARSGDVLKLMRVVKNKVNDKFGILLEPEIKIWR